MNKIRALDCSTVKKPASTNQKPVKRNYSVSLPVKLNKQPLPKDTVNFGSRVIFQNVIWKNATGSLIDNLSKFIDKFEDATASTRNLYKGARLFSSTHQEYVDGDRYEASYLGGGISGDAYRLKVNGTTEYVIKENKEKSCSDPVYGLGGLAHEYDVTEKYAYNTKFQQGIAFMLTENGNHFLISKFEEGQPAGRNDSGFRTLTQEGIKDTLNILAEMDKNGDFNPDWNIGNIFFNGDDKYPKVIDLQWVYLMDGADNYFPFVAGEKRTNFASLEGGVIASYTSHLFEKTGSKTEARDFLKMYLQERAKHCDTSNNLERLRKAVYENPSDDVLDAELLRMSMIKNNNHQFLYTDRNVETPRDMLKMLRYQARANYAAKMLSEFQPQKSSLTSDESAYFNEMRKMGDTWHSMTKRNYKGSIEWMKKLVAGDEYQNRATGYYYFPDKFGKYQQVDSATEYSVVKDKTNLSEVLSTHAKTIWDSKMERNEVIHINGRSIVLPSLKTQIFSLENKFLNLSKATDYYSKLNIKNDIDQLIPEVLI